MADDDPTFIIFHSHRDALLTHMQPGWKLSMDAMPRNWARLFARSGVYAGLLCERMGASSSLIRGPRSVLYCIVR